MSAVPLPCAWALEMAPGAALKASAVWSGSKLFNATGRCGDHHAQEADEHDAHGTYWLERASLEHSLERDTDSARELLDDHVARGGRAIATWCARSNSGG